MDEKDREMIGNLIDVVKFLVKQVENEEKKFNKQISNAGYSTTFVHIEGLQEAEFTIENVEDYFKRKWSSNGRALAW